MFEWEPGVFQRNLVRFTAILFSEKKRTAARTRIRVGEGYGLSLYGERSTSSSALLGRLLWQGLALTASSVRRLAILCIVAVCPRCATRPANALCASTYSRHFVHTAKDVHQTGRTSKSHPGSTAVPIRSSEEEVPTAMGIHEESSKVSGIRYPPAQEFDGILSLPCRACSVVD